jgi:biopolymer transport protein ExbD
MKIPREDDSESDVINTSPFVDIMFILIIFFLVTMSFNEQEQDISVNLPQTDTRLSSAAKALIINIRQDGSYYLMSQKMNLQNIQAELIEALRNNPDQKVLIRGDQNALHGQVAAAIVVCKQSGIRDANIGYLTTAPAN